MLCIIIFIIFLLLFPVTAVIHLIFELLIKFGLVKENPVKDYWYLFKKSWSCVFTKIQFKACDIDLGSEVKAKLLSKYALRFPKLIRFFEKTFGFWSFLFVAVSVYSLVYTAIAGLNLYVYDTCNPTSESGCSLAGESCSVSLPAVSFTEAITENKLGTWISQPFTTTAETISRIPDRMKTWKAADYVADTASYYGGFKEGKPVATEFIDPGCASCQKLWKNIKSTDFKNRYNLTYVLYPIPSKVTDNGYRFKNSYLLASYIETLKDYQSPNDSKISPDWQFLDKVFTASDPQLGDYQYQFSFIWGSESDQALGWINQELKNMGFSDQQITEINQKRKSDEIKNRLQSQRDIVEKEVKTIKIPTIMFNDKRFDRVVEPEVLNKN